MKHLSIDTGVYASEMLINAAKDILEENKTISINSTDFHCESFTMKVDSELKRKIKNFCLAKNVKIKNFWAEAAYVAIKKNKGGKTIEND